MLAALGSRVGHKGHHSTLLFVGTVLTSFTWGAPPTDSVLEPELGTPQQQVKGGWLLLVCHFLDALQRFWVIVEILPSYCKTTQR